MNLIEVAFVALVGLIIGLARWRAYQWRRSPLAQANVPLARRRAPDDEQRLTPRQTALLAIAMLIFFAWAGVPIISEFIGPR